MDVTLSMILGGLQESQAISEYIGLIGSLKVKIDQLSDVELNAALVALEQAQISVIERRSLLLEARSRFNKAINLEKNERLICAYLGLSLCHYQLGDLNNTRNTLFKLSSLDTNITLKEIVNAAWKDSKIRGSAFDGTLVFEPLFLIAFVNYIRNIKRRKKVELHPTANKLLERKENIEEIQKQAKEYAEEL